MQLSRIIESLESLAPLHFAEPWDNVGLLAGDPAAEIGAVMLTIDCTADVLAEAAEARCELIVAYHPPIFHPLKRLGAGNIAFEAIRRGIALYSPHTALDAAEGGTNDLLCDVLGLTERKPLRMGPGRATHYKLVVFVPTSHVEEVSDSIFAAGAGRIGDYASCSFRIPGTGTFFGEAGTQPAVGQSGRLEKVEEIRLETVVPVEKAGAVVSALHRSHPYEEPAFDLNVLAAPAGHGQGRIGTLAKMERSAMLAKIRRELGLEHLLIAGPREGAITRVAVCAGAGGELLDDALAAGAELYLTGELRHHDALKAAAGGMTVVCTLHSNSERPVLARVKARLEVVAGMPAVHVSHRDRDPFVVV